jgi:ribosomal RNA-processing protein 1
MQLCESKDDVDKRSYTNPRIPISLSTHLSDLYMTELDRVLSSSSIPSPSTCPLISLLEPFSTLVARTPSPVVYTRLMDTMFLPLLKALSAASALEGAVEGPTGKKRRTDNGSVGTGTAANAGVEGHENIIEQSSPSGAAAQKAAVLQSLFSAAADEQAKEANRRKVYIVWNEMGGADQDAEEDW